MAVRRKRRDLQYRVSPYELYRQYSTYAPGKADRVGIYKVSADGRTIDKLTSYDWLVPSRRTVTAFSPSPDATKIAVLATLHDSSYYGDAYKHEIWVMNSDGSNMKLLDSLPFENDYVYKKRYQVEAAAGEDNKYILRWNPDNKTIAYGVTWWEGTANWPAADNYWVTARGKRL